MACDCHPRSYFDTGKLTIDGARRVVLPKALRDAGGISAGATLEATVRNGRIENAVPPSEVGLERRDDVTSLGPCRSKRCRPSVRTPCARAAGAEELATLNGRDFERLDVTCAWSQL